jgi:phage shock protein A
MNPFKRLYVSVKTQINEVADDFENHEAVAEAAIHELEKLAARTRMQIGRIDREVKAMEERQAALRNDAAAWAERAVRVAADEARALECVRRLEAVEREAAAAARAHQETLSLRQKIRAEYERQTAKLDEAKRRRALLSSRQYQAEYANLPGLLGGDAVGIDAVFDRWEVRLSTAELGNPDLPEPDSLAAEFERAEKAEALRQRLADLVGAAGPAESESNSSKE